MLIKNNNKISLYLILIFFFLTQNLTSDEFNITASNIKLLQDSEKIIAEGNVIIEGQDGIIIEAESATYDKKISLIDAERSVKVTDTKTNDVLTSDKIQYSKNKDEILAEGNVVFKGSTGVAIKTEKAVYDKKNQIVKSNKLTKASDKFGNSILMDKFYYSVKNKNLRSKGNIEITDEEKNKYFFDDIFVDFEKERMAGSNVKVVFNKSNECYKFQS